MIWALLPRSTMIGLIIVVVSVVDAEDSRDVWHHDLGVALINNPRPSKPGRESSAKIEKDAIITTTTANTLPRNNDDRSGNYKSSHKETDATNKNRQDEYADLSGNSSELDICDFGGRKLRVAVSPQPPLVNCIQNLYGDWLCNGSNIEVIGVLESRLNFQAEWVVLTSSTHLDRLPRTSGRQGDELRNWAFVKDLPGNLMNYTGVIGMVGSGRAWLSANGLMSTSNRQRDLILSEPFDSFRLHFLLSKSVRDHDHIFIKPFSMNAWLAIIGSSLIMVPIFYLINTTSSHYSLLDDRFLSRITLSTCARYFLTRAKQKSLNLCRYKRSAIRRHSTQSSSSSSSSSTSFDEKLDKMITAPDYKVWPERALELEKRKRRRAFSRRWALERRKARRAGRAKRKSGFFKAAYIVWYVVGSLANQGGETEDLPHASSTRILIAFWWLYLIVICSIHSGILTAILTFPKQNDFIQNLDDYMAIGTGGGKPMKMLVDKNSELSNLLSDPDNLHKSPLQLLVGAPMGDKRSPTAIHYPIVYVDFQRHRQRILDEVQRGQSAYLEEKSTINLIITQEYFDQRPARCQFKSSRYPIDIVPMSLVLGHQLPSACVSSINGIMRNIMRTGLAQKWRRNYEALGNDCLNTVVINAGDVDKIELKHVELAFWLLLVGLSCGAIFLVIEVVWLFTAEVDESSSSSGSSSTSSSDESDDDDYDNPTGAAQFQKLKLGHKAAMLSLNSGGRGTPLKLRSLSRRHLKRPPPLPAAPIPIELGLSEVDMTDLESVVGSLKAGVKGASSAVANPQSSGNKTKVISGDSNKQDKKRKRAARAAHKRARRVRRTIGLVRRLQEGKIYSEFFMKVSGNVQNRARRASQAIVSRLAVNVPTNKLAKPSSTGVGGHLSAMNQPSGRQPNSVDGPPIRRRLRLGSSQVIPSG